MLGNRLLIVFMLGACFLTASAAWADDMGYVNCSSHPEDTQVFGKARRTPETVASLPCGSASRFYSTGLSSPGSKQETVR
jgi:hypothetical protein